MKQNCNGCWMLVVMLVIFAALLIIFAMAPKANAHDWYTHRTDPVFGNRCCGGTDCKPVPVDAAWITLTPDGLLVHMSLEQTRLVNKSSIGAINELVPWARVQEANIDDHDNLSLYHVCITSYAMDDRLRDGTRLYCIFMKGSAG